MNMIRVLRFRAANKDIFAAIRSGNKKIETRAASLSYLAIKKGDTLKFVCGKRSFARRVKKATRFRSVTALLRRYRFSAINPFVRSEKELRAMYTGFPGYKERLKQGIIAFELERF